jgi:antitoxin VapB
LIRAAREAGLGGVLLATHHNIAWLTAGRGNRIDASRETGTARLLVTADGHRHVLANTIEMPRLLDEELTGLEFSPIEYPWASDQEPGTAVAAARKVTTGTIGADWPLPDTVLFEGRIARARALLTLDEIDRYRALGHDVGKATDEVCRTLAPGEEEREIARTVVHALARVHARAVVMLVGADERIGRYRHPVPTAARWRDVVLVAVCAERDGLIAAASRLVATRNAPADLDARTSATASVFGRLLHASRPGATGAQLFETAAEAYRAAGFPGEESHHHQGGAIGYRAREWVAHPRSQEVVQARQAFAWNPSVAGTKVEDTALVTDDGVELITMSPEWPSIRMTAQGQELAAAAVLRRD